MDCRQTKQCKIPLSGRCNEAGIQGHLPEKLQLLLSKDLLQTQGMDVEKQMRQASFKKWKVYAKSPFGSVASVVEYLGRYTHKVAITKHRILSITDHSVTFKYNDYRDGSKQKTMPLSIAEFLRRFELHFLPRGFVKIRHYIFLQNHGKMARLNAVRTQMKLQALPPKINVPVAVRMLEQYCRDVTLCPECKTGHLQLVAILYPKDIAVKFKLPAALSKTVLLKNKASP